MGQSDTLNIAANCMQTSSVCIAKKPIVHRCYVRALPTPNEPVMTECLHVHTQKEYVNIKKEIAKRRPKADHAQNSSCVYIDGLEAKPYSKTKMYYPCVRPSADYPRQACDRDRVVYSSPGRAGSTGRFKLFDRISIRLFLKQEGGE